MTGRFYYRLVFLQTTKINKMGLPKGRTNNPHGRKKGVPNKVTKDLKIWVKDLIDENTDQLEKDLKNLEPKDRWQVIQRLMEYTLPKQRSIEANINYENLSDEQLDLIINKLSEGIE